MREGRGGVGLDQSSKLKRRCVLRYRRSIHLKSDKCTIVPELHGKGVITSDGGPKLLEPLNTKNNVGTTYG